MPEISAYQLRKLRKASRQLVAIREAHGAYLDRTQTGEGNEIANVHFQAELARILQK